jgi:hypothetical protein
MTNPEHLITIELVNDPERLEQARPRWQQFDTNWLWFKDRAPEVYRTHRGKHVCVAGQELFVADTAEEALRLARSSHPEDQGFFTLYIPLELVPRVYAH